MSVIENMPDILCRCKGYDPGVLFIVGRPKDEHVICYIRENGTIVPYWRMQDGSKVELSYFEKLVLVLKKLSFNRCFTRTKNIKKKGLMPK